MNGCEFLFLLNQLLDLKKNIKVIGTNYLLIDGGVKYFSPSCRMNFPAENKNVELLTSSNSRFLPEKVVLYEFKATHLDYVSKKDRNKKFYDHFYKKRNW